MPEEPFFERFRRVLEENELRPEQAATIMETSVDVVRRLSDGRTKQAKFDEALRLCDRLGIDPWYLAFGRSRLASAPAAPVGRDVEQELAAAQEELQGLRGDVTRLQTTQQSIDTKIGDLTQLIERLLPPE